MRKLIAIIAQLPCISRYLLWMFSVVCLLSDHCTCARRFGFSRSLVSYPRPTAGWTAMTAGEHASQSSPHAKASISHRPKRPLETSMVRGRAVWEQQALPILLCLSFWAELRNYSSLIRRALGTASPATRLAYPMAWHGMTWSIDQDRWCSYVMGDRLMLLPSYYA